MTAAELSDLIVQKLARENGGGAMRWRKALGQMKVYSRATHAHCNWDVRPQGSPREAALVERAADALRVRHAFVDED